MVDFIAPMDAVAENLAKLQAVELERSHLLQEARSLPVQIAQAEAALTHAQSEAANISDALAREETLRTRLERDIAEHRKKADRFRAQRDSVTTAAQAEAIEHEVAFAAAEIERLENEEIASLERTEAHEASLAKARAQVELMAGALDKTRDRIAGRQREIASEQVTLQAQREILRKSIDGDWLARFDRLFAARGSAMSRAANQQCTACRMGIRPQIWNQVREGQLLPCDSCGQLLYWDPSMTPAPAPDDGPRNSAPPAILKPRRVV